MKLSLIKIVVVEKLKKYASEPRSQKEKQQDFGKKKKREKQVSSVFWPR